MLDESRLQPDSSTFSGRGKRRAAREVLRSLLGGGGTEVARHTVVVDSAQRVHCLDEASAEVRVEVLLLPVVHARSTPCATSSVRGIIAARPMGSGPSEMVAICSGERGPCQAATRRRPHL